MGALVHYAQLPKAPALAALGDRRLEQDCALSGGDDYELLFTAAQSSRAELEALGAELGIALTRVGAIQTGDKLVLLDAAGGAMPCGGGYDHFAP